MPGHIIFEQQGKQGIITLNRPQALNALTLEMIGEISALLERAEADSGIAEMVFRGAGGRAFCAGGDIKAAWEMTRAHRAGQGPHARTYFAAEYAMNRRLFHFPKPTTAHMHGITMGGGFGIAGPCGRRVAYANSVFAMPETGIGLFPDVGSMYFLTRCPGQSGCYLAITGRTVPVADMLYAGIATKISGEEKVPESELKARQAQIDTHFRFSAVEEIVASLRGDQDSWAQGTADLIETRSPTSLKITLRHFRAAAGMSFDAITAQDETLAANVMDGHDFHEGVRAALIDKDKSPRWNPPALAQVTDAAVAAYFEP